MSTQIEQDAAVLSLEALLHRPFSFRSKSGLQRGTLQRVRVTINRTGMSRAEVDRCVSAELKRNYQKYMRDISGQTYVATGNTADAPTAGQIALYKRINAESAYVYMAKDHECRIREKASPIDALMAQVRSGETSIAAIAAALGITLAPQGAEASISSLEDSTEDEDEDKDEDEDEDAE